MKNQQTWNRQQIEEQIKSALTDLTPDIWNRLDLSVPQESWESGLQRKTAGGKKISFVGRARAMAAAACLCLLLGGGFSYYEFGQIVTVVGLDVNPSVELCLNRQDRVVKSIALNEDGEAIISRKDINGRKLEEAVDSVITTMTEQGYLKKNESERSAVLVTVSSKKKDDRKQELCQNLSSNVEHSLAANEVQAVVYEQPAVVEEEARQEILELAKEYQISQGKASFIQALVEENENVQAEDIPSLAAMTMGEISVQIDQQSYQLKSEVQVTSVTEETIRRVKEEEPEGRISMLAQEEAASLETGRGSEKKDAAQRETEAVISDESDAENRLSETIDAENVGDVDQDSDIILEIVGDVKEKDGKTDGLVGEKDDKTGIKSQDQKTEDLIQAADTGKAAAGAQQAGQTGQPEPDHSPEEMEVDQAGVNQPADGTEADQDEKNRPWDNGEAGQPVTNEPSDEGEAGKNLTNQPSDGNGADQTETIRDLGNTSQEQPDMQEDPDQTDDNQDGTVQEMPGKADGNLPEGELPGEDNPLEATTAPDSSPVTDENFQKENPEQLPAGEDCTEDVPAENPSESSSKKNPGTVRTDSVPYETGEKTAVIKRDEIHQILEQMENEAEWCWKNETGDPVISGPGTVDRQEDEGQKDERQKILPGPGMEESIWEREFLDQEDQVARWLHGPGISPNGDRLMGYSIHNSTAPLSGTGSFSGLFNNRGIIRRDSKSKIRMNVWYRSLMQNFEEIR